MDRSVTFECFMATSQELHVIIHPIHPGEAPHTQSAWITEAVVHALRSEGMATSSIPRCVSFFFI
jgi:hypothetical protein